MINEELFLRYRKNNAILTMSAMDGSRAVDHEMRMSLDMSESVRATPVLDLNSE